MTRIPPPNPDRRRRRPPEYPGTAPAAPPGAPLAYETPRPKRHPLKRMLLWFKRDVDGPVGNVLAAAFIILMIVAYVALRARAWRTLFDGGR